MQDLGTLGGPDALPLFMNNRGQIAGMSYTGFTANPATGQPTLDPFLWQNGHMQDLGSLGGTLGFANDMNSSGAVAGQSDLAGDQTSHPFLWDGHTLQDLGTLGGANGGANWVNDGQEVAGSADLPGSQVHHAFLWKHGAMTDLGTLNGDPCSLGDAMNNRGQVVGSSTSCQVRLTAFLWDHGVIADLNSLVAPSDLHIVEAHAITDRGEIVGGATLPDGTEHVVVLLPTDEAGRQGLSSNAPAPGTVVPTGKAQPRPATCPASSLWRAHAALWHDAAPCRGA
jgi:probable HAF family extracellular repeat protein